MFWFQGASLSLMEVSRCGWWGSGWVGGRVGSGNLSRLRGYLIRWICPDQFSATFIMNRCSVPVFGIMLLLNFKCDPDVFIHND